MIRCEAVTKDFFPQRVLHGLDFQIENGEFVAISGRSGSGKSTLLYIISTLDHPTSGTVWIDGKNVTAFSEHDVHLFRKRSVGFIFQSHYLLPELTALENVLLPARNLGLLDTMKNSALQLLEELEIADQAHKYPGQMSGGQQQRVAIARALALNPKYIFADEPTGNLDSHNAQKVMQILERINKENKTTICLVTHDPGFAAIADREIYLIDGRISHRNAE